MPMLDISPSGSIQKVTIAQYIESCLKNFEKRKLIKKDFKVFIKGLQYCEMDCFLHSGLFSAENSARIKEQVAIKRKEMTALDDGDIFQIYITIKRRKTHFDCAVINNSVYMRRSYSEAKDEKKG